jgi:hypothetical protein
MSLVMEGDGRGKEVVDVEELSVVGSRRASRQGIDLVNARAMASPTVTSYSVYYFVSAHDYLSCTR